MELNLKLRFSTIVVLISVALALSGCGGGSKSATGTFGKGTGASNGTWTVLVYLNADNDLERYGILNFNQMEMVGSTANVKIVVQFDRSPGYDTTNGNWIGCRRYLVTKDSDPNIMHSQLLEDMGNVDMGNPDTLRAFITWGQQNYPADHYCLVVWNHGSGWRSRTLTVGEITRNVSFDDTSGTSIKTTDFAYAVGSASPKIDLIAMDASLMQMLEVAYELRDSAQLLVASEESPPGEGYVYDKWLAPLAANPGMSPRELGTVIAQQYVQAYVNSYFVTQSVVQLSNVPAVAAAVNDLGAAILPHATTDAAALATARQSAQAYAFDYYKDLSDYAQIVNQLLPDPAIATAYSKLQTALSAAVLYEAHTGTEVAKSHGLSIYVPTPTQYASSYESLHFTQDYPNWDALLKAQTQ